MSVDRGFTWMDDETFALIEIFSTDDIQDELNGSKRNIGVYEKIAAELGDVGFRRTAYQCREKIKRLRKEYHHNKYCLENDIPPKKPMKYYDLVDKIFNQDSSPPSTSIDLNLLNADISDNEDELHFTFNPEAESDASTSCCQLNESFALQPPLPSSYPPASSPAMNECNSLPPILEAQLQDSSCNENSKESTGLNAAAAVYDLSDKDSAVDAHESPWVPNVVLIENDSESVGLDNGMETQEDSSDDASDDEYEKDSQKSTLSLTTSKESSEPPGKKLKTDPSLDDLEDIADKMTDTFLKCQQSVQSQLLEQLFQLEKARMQRDETRQRLWMEFEARQRKQDREHHLKLLSLLEQFVKQLDAP